MRVFISIGSNLGDRAANCKEAVKRLASNGGVRVIRESSLYETEPWGVVDQGPFINSAVEIETTLSPRSLFGLIKSIEAAMGRSKGEKWGPRVIDLDILLCDGLLLDDEGLKVPHPSIAERAFVLVPLNEIAPDLVHPVLGKTVSELLSGLKDRSWVTRLKDNI